MNSLFGDETRMFRRCV